MDGLPAPVPQRCNISTRPRFEFQTWTTRGRISTLKKVVKIHRAEKLFNRQDSWWSFHKEAEDLLQAWVLMYVVPDALPPEDREEERHQGHSAGCSLYALPMSFVHGCLKPGKARIESCWPSAICLCSRNLCFFNFYTCSLEVIMCFLSTLQGFAQIEARERELWPGVKIYPKPIHWLQRVLLETLTWVCGLSFKTAFYCPYKSPQSSAWLQVPGCSGPTCLPASTFHVLGTPAALLFSSLKIPYSSWSSRSLNILFPCLEDSCSSSSLG